MTKSFKSFLLENLSSDTFINEAITYKDMAKALELILKYLNSKLGRLYQLPGFETVKSKEGVLLGIHYINDEGKSLRFNWSSKGKLAEEIHSIDFYEPAKMFSPTPNVTIKTNGESMARILPAVVETFKKMAVINIDKFKDESVKEGRKPIPDAPSKSKNYYQEMKAKMAAIERGEAYTDISSDYKNAQKLLDQTPYADPETIFDDVDAYIEMVVKRLQPSLIVAGGPGIGKTFGITKKIKSMGLRKIEPIEIPDGLSADELRELGIDMNAESDGDWVHIKGASTAFGMYMNLFRYKEKLVVFDDCDSVFNDKDGVNILKGALDSNDKRVISWISKSTTGAKAVAPPRFEFKGRIIFISNLPMKKIDDAIRSRSFVVDINLKMEDVLKRIETILPKIGADSEVPLTMDAKMRAFEFLKEKASEEGVEMEISIRTLVNFAKIAQSGVSQWRRLMEIQAQNI